MYANNTLPAQNGRCLLPTCFLTLQSQRDTYRENTSAVMAANRKRVGARKDRKTVDEDGTKLIPGLITCRY